MKRYHKQCICMVVAASLLAAGAAMAGVSKPTVVHAEGYKNSDQDEAMEDIIETVAGVKDVNGDGFDKEETVYIITDAEGAPNEVIASEWLKNMKGSDRIEDRSTLQDIKNVKGYEKYVQGKGDDLTWEANGSDIYYQGTPTEESPVTLHISYKLDGKPISPEDIKGKSGKVEIRFDYENKTDDVIDVDGDEEHVSVPFTMLTGVLLPNDIFDNVEVENARLISEGNNAIVIGYAFPGLYESLKYDEFKDNLDEEQREKAEELDISDHVVIRADATDFELNSTMTVALPDVLKEVSFTDNIDTDKVKDDMDELADATDELIDGTGELLDGVGELKDGTSELRDGVSEIKDATRDIKDGTEDILSGSNDLVDGTWDLKEGICEAYGGTEKLYDGTRKLHAGSGEAYDGSKQLDEGVKQLTGKLTSKSADIILLSELAKSLAQSLGNMGGTGGGAGGSGRSEASGSVTDLENSLMMMDEARSRAALSVSMLSAAEPESVSEDEADEEDEREEYEEILNAMYDSADSAVSLYDSLQELTALLEDRTEELTEEKESLEEELEELGEPSFDDEEPDPEDLSGDDIREAYAGYYREYFNEKYSEYYSQYYGIKERIDVAEEQLSLLSELKGSLEEITDSAKESSDTVSGAAAKMQKILEEDVDDDEDEDEEEDTDDTKEDLIAEIVSANMISARATDAVWAVVNDLQAMNMIRLGYRGGNLGASPIDGMTPAQIADYLLSLPAAQMNAAFKSGMLTTGQKQAVVAAMTSEQKVTLLSRLDAENKQAVYTMLGGNKGVSATVAGGLSQLAGTLASPSAKSSLAALSAGAGSLMDGLGELHDGTGELHDGMRDLKKGMGKLSNGGEKLYDGTVDLRDGVQDLDDGAGELNDGAWDLNDGAEELDDGVQELYDGAEELHDGMIEFDEEGIQKLIDLFGDNVTDMLDRLEAIQETGADYQSFSGKSDSMEGSVKFILKTDEIKAD